MYSDFNKLFDVIKTSETIVLTGHSNPDGDAIGSTMALALALKKMGKNPIVLFESFSEKFNIIPNTENIFNGDATIIVPDLFITLDCGDLDRLNEEAYLVYKKSTITANIDHHVSNMGFADYNIVDVKASSTSEIVFTIIENMVEVDKDIVSCVYAGIVYDTAGFRHINTSGYTHKIANKAHELGIGFNEIYNSIIGQHSITEIEIFKKALSHINIDLENKIISTYITQKDIEEAGSTSKELGSIVSYLISTDNMDVALFAYEKEDAVKVSLRSKGVDVNKVAANFGGGGHVRAAGCKLKTDIHSSIKIVTEKIKEVKNCYE